MLSLIGLGLLLNTSVALGFLVCVIWMVTRHAVSSRGSVYLQCDDVEAALRAANEAPETIPEIAEMLLSAPMRAVASPAKPKRQKCEHCSSKPARYRVIAINGVEYFNCALHFEHYRSGGGVSQYEEIE